VELEVLERREGLVARMELLGLLELAVRAGPVEPEEPEAQAVLTTRKRRS